eukprot:6731289-Pyramimonas_sp.AAC.1
MERGGGGSGGLRKDGMGRVRAGRLRLQHQERHLERAQGPGCGAAVSPSASSPGAGGVVQP